jgi:hypothetical protein
MNTAAALFDNKFNSITNVVEFNSKWSNGRGYFNANWNNYRLYFNAAVEAIDDSELGIALILKPGVMAKCISPDDRKMIFVGTDLGTCLVFQKYSGSSDTLITNQARFLASSGFIENGPLSYDALKRIVGGEYFDEPNIGITIANVKRCFVLAEAIVC